MVIFGLGPLIWEQNPTRRHQEPLRFFQNKVLFPPIQKKKNGAPGKAKATFLMFGLRLETHLVAVPLIAP